MSAKSEAKKQAKLNAQALEGNRKKELGQVYTPFGLVKEMLDLLDKTTFNLKTKDLMWKTFLEPSCGNGQFVLGIIRKLMDAYEKDHKVFDCPAGWKSAAFSHILEVQLFGIELDPVELAKCLERIKEIAKAYDVDLITFNHNLICGSALEVDIQTVFTENMKNWGPFIAKTTLQLITALEYKLPAISTETTFNPAEIDVFNEIMKNR